MQGFAQNLFVQELNVVDVPFAHEEAVEEIYQQILVDFLPEDALKAHVGEGIDELCHS